MQPFPEPSCAGLSLRSLGASFRNPCLHHTNAFPSFLKLQPEGASKHDLAWPLLPAGDVIILVLTRGRPGPHCQADTLRRQGAAFLEQRDLHVSDDALRPASCVTASANSITWDILDFLVSVKNPIFIACITFSLLALQLSTTICPLSKNRGKPPPSCRFSLNELVSNTVQSPGLLPEVDSGRLSR